MRRLARYSTVLRTDIQAIYNISGQSGDENPGRNPRNAFFSVVNDELSHK